MAAKKKAKKKPDGRANNKPQVKVPTTRQREQVQKYHQLKREITQLDREKSLQAVHWRRKFDFLNDAGNQEATAEDVKRVREYGSALAFAHLVDVMQGLVPDTTPAQRLEAAKLLRTGRKADNGGEDGQTDDDPDEMRKILAEAERRKAGTARDLE